MPVPARPKIYHIVHIDRLASIIADGFLWSDAVMATRESTGTTIGMSRIKERRLKELRLSCHPDLLVGQCVPFYFCPRSVMLFLIHRKNEELAYRGGEEPIIHLEADLYDTIAWAEHNQKKWAFTLSNAGGYYFEDRSNVDKLSEINWEAILATKWSGNGVSASVKEGKQAEFLIEQAFPWQLVERVGVHSRAMAPRVASAMDGAKHRPRGQICPEWYY